MSAASGTKSRWPARVVTTSRITSWAIWSRLIAVGWWCRRRAARSAMTTATAAGQSAPCGVPATAATWRGAAIAAQCFTRRSPGRRVESATSARCRCLKTSSGIAAKLRHQHAIPGMISGHEQRFIRRPAYLLSRRHLRRMAWRVDRDRRRCIQPRATGKRLAILLGDPLSARPSWARRSSHRPAARLRCQGSPKAGHIRTAPLHMSQMRCRQ